MDRGDIKHLWYLTHVANALSIMKHGILAHNKATQLTHKRIDNTDVNDRRIRQLPNGRSLHDYANLYFWPRNGMMYALTHGKVNYTNDLILFAVSKSVFEIEGVLVSDMNAAKGGALIGDWRIVLPKLVHAEIFTKSWSDPDEKVKKRKMARMMAEVLVPGSVPPNYITGCCVPSHDSRTKLEKQDVSFRIVVRNELFFSTYAGAARYG